MGAPTGSDDSRQDDGSADDSPQDEEPADAGGGRRWRGVAMAERQAVRRQALVAAGFDLIGTVGWAGTTVRGVCAAATLNPRYFYESFADLDQLLLAVYDHVVAEAVAAVLVGAAAGPDLPAVVRGVIDAGFRFLAEDPRRARVLFVEAAGHRLLDRRRFDTMLAMAGRVKAMGSTLSAGTGLDATGPGGESPGGTGPAGAGATGLAAEADPRVDRLGTVAANLLVGGVTELCLAWLDGQLDMTLDELIDDVAALAVGTAETAARLVEPSPATGPSRSPSPADADRSPPATDPHQAHPPER